MVLLGAINCAANLRFAFAANPSLTLNLALAVNVTVSVFFTPFENQLTTLHMVSALVGRHTRRQSMTFWTSGASSKRRTKFRRANKRDAEQPTRWTRAAVACF